ncbi:MAG: hypothetical protein JO069_19345 [Verrucomicrobia bacterium]|nr:hypothetical protein [Verrucomicrobiota bacterium]
MHRAPKSRIPCAVQLGLAVIFTRDEQGGYLQSQVRLAAMWPAVTATV